MKAIERRLSGGEQAPTPLLRQGSAPASGRAALDDTIELSLAPERVLRWLLGAIACLLVTGTCYMIVWLVFGYAFIHGIGPLFHLDAEHSFPAYFSALQLFAAAALLGLIAWYHWRLHSPWRWHWLVLAVGFVAMSFDEALRLHERMNRPVRVLLDNPDFAAAWIVPMLVVLPLLGLAYLRFLLALPRRFAKLFVTSGAMFLAGAIGLEAVGGEILERSETGKANWAFQIQIIVEEALEMLGIALFVYSLLAYIANAKIRVTVAAGD